MRDTCLCDPPLKTRPHLPVSPEPALLHSCTPPPLPHPPPTPTPTLFGTRHQGSDPAPAPPLRTPPSPSAGPGPGRARCRHRGCRRSRGRVPAPARRRAPRCVPHPHGPPVQPGARGLCCRGAEAGHGGGPEVWGARAHHHGQPISGAGGCVLFCVRVGSWTHVRVARLGCWPPCSCMFVG
jgi:hypothetical protein